MEEVVSDWLGLKELSLELYIVEKSGIYVQSLWSVGFC